MESNIIADLKDSYGIACQAISPVAGGWLNLKWKVTTQSGVVLVKQFSKKRYSREKLKLTEFALQRQMILHREGVPCPFIWPCAGNAIRLLNDDIAYMVMDFCPGKVESPGTITATQMQSLGAACGRMHQAFSGLPTSGVEGFPISGAQTLDALWENFHTRMRECSPCAPAGYREALLAQEPILKQLTAAFFDKLPQGIAHEDFASDNILFGTDGVSAVLDFDRNHYSYLWHDIGRAILSFAWNDHRLDREKISAFLNGYSRHLPLTLPDIADALRLTWCMEIPWWIQPGFFGEAESKVIRFKDEIVWLTEHWPELDRMLCSQ